MGSKWERFMEEAENFYRQGNYREAIKYYQKAVEEARRVFGITHPNYTLNLNGLTIMYKLTGEYDQAESLYRRILQIEGNERGEMQPDYATNLSNLAELYRTMGKYRKAEQLNREAFDIRINLFGDEHPEVAASLHNRALLYKNWGKYKDAEYLYRRALAIWEKAVGRYYPQYASSLNGLAGVFVEKGEYHQAEVLYLKTLGIREKVLGREHPLYALTLNNLAELHRMIGGLEEYGKAEYLHKEALNIRERTSGKNSLEYAQSLNNLALLYDSMRIYYEAWKKYVEGEVKRKYEEAERKYYKEAEHLYLQALNIYEKIEKELGTKPLDLSSALNNLCNLYLSKGYYEKAESYIRQALDIIKTVLGDNHPRIASNLANLAALHTNKKEYGEAERLLYQALNIIENQLGKNHPEYGFILIHLAGIENLTGRPEAAMNRLLEVSTIDTRMINCLSSVGDERRLQSYIWTFQPNYSLLLSNFTQHYEQLKEYTPRVYDFVLTRKALNLEILAVKRDSILSGNDPQLKKEFEQLRQMRMALSRLLLQGPGYENPRVYLEQISAVETEIEIQEKMLASKVPQFELDEKLANADHKKIAEKLPEDTCLIEYVFHRPFDFKKKEYLTPCYLAFIFSKNVVKKGVQKVDIGDASEIDKLIQKYKCKISARFKVTEECIEKLKLEGLPVNVLKSLEKMKDQGIIGKDQFLEVLGITIDDEQIVRHKSIILKHALKVPDELEDKDDDRKEFENSILEVEKGIDTGKSLYEKLFLPVLKEIGETKKFIISPDGNIALLPFEIMLQKENGRYVVEDFEISYINSGRDLLRFENPHKPQSCALVIANDELPGAKEEAESIWKVFNDFKYKINVWIGKDAQKGKLEKVQGPQILHIATHGFFRLSQKTDEGFFLESTEFTNRIEQSKRLLNIKRENPLLRSGVVLKDGKLTALDVTGMDLIGTDLVVLSACETGIGEVQATEGVHGLRRAFIIAGARTLIVSLWKVPDKETKELMVNFYEKILSGKAKAEALREAQREMINQRRMDNKPDSPYYWGAFVCIGDPARMEINSQCKTINGGNSNGLLG